MNAGENHPPYPYVVLVVRLGELPTTVNGDLVSMIGKLGADLFGELLETAVPIGDATRADDRDLQGRSPIEGAGMSAGICDWLASANAARGVSQNHHSRRRSETRRRD